MSVFRPKCGPFLTLLFMLNVSSAIELKLGCLLESESSHYEEAFKQSLYQINTDNNHPLQVTGELEWIERTDRGFHVSRKVCSLVNKGIAGLLCPKTEKLSTLVKSVSEALHFPFFDTRWYFRTDRSTSLSINLFPHPDVLSQAYRDLIQAKGWRKFAVVYKDNDGLIRLQDVIKDDKLRKQQVLFKLSDFDYRMTFKEIKRKNVRQMIIDVPADEVRSVLKAAQSMLDFKSIIFTSLDLQTINWKEIRDINGKVSAFSLIDPSVLETARQDDKLYNNLTTDAALIMDSIKIFAKGVQDFSKSEKFSAEYMNCDPEKPWESGLKLTNFIKMTSIRGLTGDLRLDFDGQRRDFKLFLHQVKNDELLTTGHWSPGSGFTDTQVYEGRTNSLTNKTLTVVTQISNPYVMYAKDWEASNLTGNDRFTGYCVDLIREISGRLGFRYEIKLSTDSAYGTKDARGEWNGMIGALIDESADMALADLTMTSERQEVVDFTMPFMTFNIGVLKRKPSYDPPSMFPHLKLISKDLKIYIVTFFLAATVVLFIAARLSPLEWRKSDKKEGLVNHFSFTYCLWFVLSCFLRQTCIYRPKALSTRFTSICWSTFGLFLLLAFHSAYVIDRSGWNRRSSDEVYDLHQLSTQNKIGFGCVASGSTCDYLKNSKNPTYNRIWRLMEDRRPSVFPETSQAGIDRVSKGDFALIAETSLIDYTIDRQCELTQMQPLLESPKGYAIAVPRGSPYRVPLNEALVKLHMKGALYQLKDKWWVSGRCGPIYYLRPRQGSIGQLGLLHFSFAILALMAGCAAALALSIIEFFWKTLRVPSNERGHILTELSRAMFSCGSKRKKLVPEEARNSIELQ